MPQVRFEFSLLRVFGAPVSQPWEFCGHSRPLISPFLLPKWWPSSCEGVRVPHTKGANPWPPEHLIPPRVGHRNRKREEQKERRCVCGEELWGTEVLSGPCFVPVKMYFSFLCNSTPIFLLEPILFLHSVQGLLMGLHG